MATDRDRHYLQRTRERIQSANLQNEMIKYIRNERDMSAGQLKACIELLNRVVPVISQQQIEVNDITERKPRDMTLSELQEAWASRQTPSHQVN